MGQTRTINELKEEIKNATKQELQTVMKVLADFAEQDNMENLYEDDMTPEEIMNCGISKKEARILWGLKTLIKYTK